MECKKANATNSELWTQAKVGASRERNFRKCAGMTFGGFFGSPKSRRRSRINNLERATKHWRPQKLLCKSCVLASGAFLSRTPLSLPSFLQWWWFTFQLPVSLESGGQVHPKQLCLSFPQSGHRSRHATLSRSKSSSSSWSIIIILECKHWATWE